MIPDRWPWIGHPCAERAPGPDAGPIFANRDGVVSGFPTSGVCMVMTSRIVQSPTSAVRRLVTAACTLVLIPAFAAAAPVLFEIPSQPAPAALGMFSKQSGVQITFSQDELKDVTAHAVTGSHEPAAPLDILLEGTGFAASPRNPHWFVVVREPATGTGGVKGSLAGLDRAALGNVSVRIKETDQSSIVDRDGAYEFTQVPAGNYTIIATADGYQPLHITDVRVRGGRELVLSRQTMRRLSPNDDVTKMAPYVVQAESITELDPFEVTDRKMKPFSDANIDIPRTIDDAQPYYIFDSRTIQLSGSTTVEDFLTNNLTMNVLRSTNTGNTTSYGTNSDVNLRGLGSDRTLVLVNGRRMPNTFVLSGTYQPDLNGISPGMIDRIEVLPTSGSGIYGGNALGGVVNIVLKQDYSGGEVWASYSNTFDSDAARRSAGLNWGRTFEGGRTRVQLAAQYSDGNAMRLQDRADLIRQNYARVNRNFPDKLYTASSPFAGATTNITNSVNANLVLDDGTVLGSRMTHVPAGLSPSATDAQVAAALVQNAGSYNLDLPSIYWLQTGLGSYFGFTPTSRSINASITRQMLPNLEMFVDYSYKRNRGESLYSSYFSSNLTVAANAPTNPFNTNVIVKMPAERLRPRIGTFDTYTVTTGAKLDLPGDWIAQFDYTWVKSTTGHVYEALNTGTLNAAILNGTIDPFVDTQLYPVSLDPYATITTIAHGATQNTLTARAHGSLLELPWGTPTLTLGLENRMQGSIDATYRTESLATDTITGNTVYLGFKQRASSAYAEFLVPLVERDRLPFAHVLELQLAARGERFDVATGTPTASINPTTGAVSWGNPNLSGKPYRDSTRYQTFDPTIGVKYQPVRSVTLRASYASGFQPPTPSQLIRNPEPNTSLANILDPKTNTSYDVATISGGNPDIDPQSSKSWNAGIIWEPESGALRGLRLNAEYYEIEQADAIGSLGAQLVVNMFPDRVTRDSSGMITLVDTSYLNLYKRDLTGWDFNASYQWNTHDWGLFVVKGTQSLILHTRTQYSLSLPSYEGVDYPIDTSIGGALRQKTNINLNWSRGRWSAGWTSHFISSYHAYGAAGGPLSLQYGGGNDYSTYVAAQGSRTIPAQDTHDAVVSYQFGESTSGREGVDRILAGTTLTLGIRNIFDTAPEFDAGPFGLGFFSPFVDIRMREYWITLRRTF